MSYPISYDDMMQTNFLGQSTQLLPDYSEYTPSSMAAAPINTWAGSDVQAPRNIPAIARTPGQARSSYVTTSASFTYAGSVQQTPIDLTSEYTPPRYQATSSVNHLRGPSGQTQQGPPRFQTTFSTNYIQGPSGQTQQCPPRFQTTPSTNYLRGPSEQAQQGSPIYLPSPQATPRMSSVQGQKRGSDAMSGASPNVQKRQIMTATNGTPAARPVQPMQNVSPAMHRPVQYAKQTQQLNQQSQVSQLEARKRAAQIAFQAEEARQKIAKEVEKRRLAQEQVAAARQKEEDRRQQLEAQHIAYNKAQAEMKAAKKREQEEQALAAAFVVELRVAEAKEVERERKAARKEQLRKDPSALFRHYQEFLEYHPLGKGERKCDYKNMLLANRPMPYDKEGDIALAVTFAKENWSYFLNYPKDIEWAAKQQKKKQDNIAADGIQEKR